MNGNYWDSHNAFLDKVRHQWKLIILTQIILLAISPRLLYIVMILVLLAVTTLCIYDSICTLYDVFKGQFKNYGGVWAGYHLTDVSDLVLSFSSERKDIIRGKLARRKGRLLRKRRDCPELSNQNKKACM